MTAPELLPCPFCGLTDYLTIHSVGSLVSSMPDRPYQVRCKNMDCEDVSGPVEYGKYKAIAAWNRRPATPEVQDLIAEARRDDTELLLDAYKGMLVLRRILDKAGLVAGASAADQIAKRIVDAHPEFPGLASLRALKETPHD